MWQHLSVCNTRPALTRIPASPDDCSRLIAPRDGGSVGGTESAAALLWEALGAAGVGTPPYSKTQEGAKSSERDGRIDRPGGAGLQQA